MIRKAQIRRGAKADLPTLSQGEFGMCVDSGAEELHLGTGAKNLQVPMVNEYSGDMNTLTTSGVYRVGTNTNLISSLWYSQVIVAKGSGSDTVMQLGVSYNTGHTISRGGTIAADGTVTWTAWSDAAAAASESDYTYGTTDLTAGSSALETGKLYFVYE